MKLAWRKLAAGEDDPEFVLGVCVLSATLLLVAVAALVPPEWIPDCLFARYTHVPCPTCGSYRALALLKAGEWPAAFVTQPLVVAGGLLAVVYTAYSWIVVLGRLPRLRFAPRPGRWLLLLLVAAVLANWLYLICWSR